MIQAPAAWGVYIGVYIWGIFTRADHGPTYEYMFICTYIIGVKKGVKKRAYILPSKYCIILEFSSFNLVFIAPPFFLLSVVVVEN